MKALLLRACVLARWRDRLKDSTPAAYARDLERRLDNVMACRPTNLHGKRHRIRYGKDRDSPFTL